MAGSLDFSVRGKKRVYLKAFTECGRLDRAALRSKVHRNTHYFWLNTDPQYRRDFETAKEMAADNIEAALYERAVEDIEKPTGWYKGEPGGYVREYDTTAAIFLLKGLRPEKYRERYEHTNNTNITLTVEQAKARIASILERRPDLESLMRPNANSGVIESKEGDKAISVSAALP